ncbi:MAG: alpha/beta fold hydrolase [Candidatus Moraniibacteriota bacterium]|jgi:carboxylesterase
MVKRIYEKVKSVLFADPQLLFQGERSLVNQSFYFQGENRRAILLIHGWTSTSYEVRRLGRYLNESGYTVSAPMLRGHGTVPRNLEDISFSDWLVDLEKEYQALKKEHGQVYVAGTSIGANLAMMLAKKDQSISGLILMATPYKIKLEKITVAFAKLLCFFKAYNKKFYPPTFGLSSTITRLISYQTYPIKSALETFELIKESRKNLEKIIQPCFIIQSQSDHVVAKKSLERIFEKIGSKIKKKKYIKRAYHTFISDIKNEKIFEEILQFLDEN